MAISRATSISINHTNFDLPPISRTPPPHQHLGSSTFIMTIQKHNCDFQKGPAHIYSIPAGTPNHINVTVTLGHESSISTTNATAQGDQKCPKNNNLCINCHGFSPDSHLLIGFGLGLTVSMVTIGILIGAISEKKVAFVLLVLMAIAIVEEIQAQVVKLDRKLKGWWKGTSQWAKEVQEFKGKSATVTFKKASGGTEVSLSTSFRA